MSKRTTLPNENSSLDKPPWVTNHSVGTPGTHIDPDKDINAAVEIVDASRVLTRAGNYLDRALIELILKESGLPPKDPAISNIRSLLELQIREYKESLFNDGYVLIHLGNGINIDIEVEVEDFLKLEPVMQFGKSLQEAAQDILESIDETWIDWIKGKPTRNLVGRTGR